MPTIITDPRKPDNPIVLANQAFLDLTGRSRKFGRNCRFLPGPETAEAGSTTLTEGRLAETEAALFIG
jgi:PAS domain-containing protein